MKIAKASTKPMVQGRSTGNDIKKLVFSHNGLLYISVDRNFHVILWNAQKQQIIKEFDDVIGHYGTFSYDDKRLFIIGRQKLHIFKVEKLQQSKQSIPKSKTEDTIKSQTLTQSVQQSTYSVLQVKRFDNGFFMGTVQCSPNNLFFAYSNSSQLYIREMINYQRIFHIQYSNFTEIEKQTIVSSTEESTKQVNQFSKLCSPFFIKFNQFSGNLYTASLNDGQICKWVFSQIESLNRSSKNQESKDLSQSQNKNREKYPIYVAKKLVLQSIVSDIDFSNNFLIISSDRNKRKVFFINETTLQVQRTRSLPKAFFLDFNTQIQSTYSYMNDMIISIAVPGDFLFFHNGTSLSFVSSFQIKMNIYTLEYENFRSNLALGGQVANQEDQIEFYRMDSSIKQDCQKGQFWHISSQSCKQLPCKQSEISQLNPQTCKCLSQFQIWSPLLQKCVLNCGTIENSLSLGFFPSINSQNLNYCPCKADYRWNFQSKKCEMFECRKVQGSTGRLNFPFSVDQCQCYQKFQYKKQIKGCILDCKRVKYSNGQSFFISQHNTTKQTVATESMTIQACACLQGYFWHQSTYSCLQKQKQHFPIPPQNTRNSQNQSKQENNYGIPEPFEPEKPKISQQSVSTVAIVIPILLTLLLITLISIMILYWKRPNCLFKRRQNQEDQKNTELSNSKKLSKVNCDNNKKNKTNPQGSMKKSQVIQELIDNSLEISVQQNESGKKEVQDEKNTTKRRRRNLHIVDSEKTAKNINFEQNEGQLDTERPMNLKPKDNIINKSQEYKNFQQNMHGITFGNFNYSKSSTKYFQGLKNHSKQGSLNAVPCQICFEDNSDGYTKCKHYFHVKCMKDQFSRYGKANRMECPSCWQPLLNGMEDFQFFPTVIHQSGNKQSNSASFQQQKQIKK